MLKFHTDSPQVMMFMIYKFHKNLFFEWPKIFEYLVVKRKNCNNFDYSLKKKLVIKYTMARFTSINHPSISSKLKLL